MEAGYKRLMRSHAYRVLHALSLDVALGISGAGWLAARVVGVRLPAVWWVVLGLTAWIVYALDHLADTRNRTADPESEQHRIYVDYRGPLRVAVACAIGIDLALASRLPGWLWAAGLPLAGLSLAYLALAQWRAGRLPKEAGAALLYTLAIWFVPALALAPESWSERGIAIGFAVAAHGCAALANLLLLSLREEPVDRRRAQRSWVIERGRNSARFALRTAGWSGLAAAFFAVALAGTGAATIAALAFGALSLWPLLLERYARGIQGWSVRALADLGFVLLWLPAWMA